jgi:hypothetical protein
MVAVGEHRCHRKVGAEVGGDFEEWVVCNLPSRCCVFGERSMAGHGVGGE